jgi:peptide/nickel transport system permease protein
MTAFIIRRLLYMLVTMFFVSIIGFLLAEAPPGDALTAEIQRLRAIGGTVSQQQIDALAERYGTNDPIYVKYTKWISGFVHGDFGESFSKRAPVNDLIWGRLGFTLLLTGGSLLFAWAIAIPIGVYSATHRYSMPDYLVTLIQFIGVAIPEFLLALIVMVGASRLAGIDVAGLFSVEYQNAPWSASKILDLINHVWIPVIVISAGTTAWMTRLMRANLLDVLNQQYVQTARSKGLRETVVIWKHAVRNAVHPLVMALTDPARGLPALISGEAIVSIVLNLPTMGPMYFRALIDQDIYLAVTLLMMFSILVIFGNIIADILLAWVDPRVRSAE